MRVAAKNTLTDNVQKTIRKSTGEMYRYISHSRNYWDSSPVRGPSTLAGHHSPAVPGSPIKTNLPQY